MAEKVAFVGLGTNLGDRQENICRALVGMAAHPGIAVERVSSLYETLPWGGVEQGSFLNAVAQLRTRLTPEELLTVLLALEDAMGRIRQEKWGPRVIDLDLLIYGNAKIQTKTLQVPHPLITERAFVLVPLAELAPDLLLGSKSVREHLHAIGKQKDDVVRWGTPPTEEDGRFVTARL